jgi:hypothetical protein
VYIFWAIFYLTSNISTTFEGTKLTPASHSKLQAEKSLELSRLLTVCEMLATEDRLDQICFLLMFLRRCIGNASKGWWKSRTKSLIKALKKNRQGRQQWHIEYAERTLKSLKHLDDEEGVERWSRRESLQLSKDHHLEFVELGKLKGE